MGQVKSLLNAWPSISLVLFHHHLHFVAHFSFYFLSSFFFYYTVCVVNTFIKWSIVLSICWCLCFTSPMRNYYLSLSLSLSFSFACILSCTPIIYRLPLLWSTTIYTPEDKSLKDVVTVNQFSIMRIEAYWPSAIYWSSQLNIRFNDLKHFFSPLIPCIRAFFF